jgi:hypothetical protein
MFKLIFKSEYEIRIESYMLELFNKGVIREWRKEWERGCSGYSDDVCDCSFGELLDNKKPFWSLYIFKHVLENKSYMLELFNKGVIRWSVRIGPEVSSRQSYWVSKCCWPSATHQPNTVSVNLIRIPMDKIQHQYEKKTGTSNTFIKQLQHITFNSDLIFRFKD